MATTNPCDARASDLACLPPRRFVAAFDELNHQALFFLRELPRPPHNLPGGTQGAFAWLLPARIADSHFIFIHTAHVYAFIYNYTRPLPRAQVLRSRRPSS